MKYVNTNIYIYIYMMDIYIWLSAFGTGQHLEKDLSATQRGELFFVFGSNFGRYGGSENSIDT